MPTLILIRHATAETFAATDHDRPLTEQGHLEAAAAGRMLARLGVGEPMTHVSTARRTRETWEEISSAAGWTRSAHHDSSLYGAGEDGVLELLAATAPEQPTVAVIGHNPTIGGLAHLLDDGEGAASAAAVAGFPPAAFAVLQVTQWAQIGPMTGRMDHFGMGRP